MVKTDSLKRRTSNNLVASEKFEEKSIHVNELTTVIYSAANSLHDTNRNWKTLEEEEEKEINNNGMESRDNDNDTSHMTSHMMSNRPCAASVQTTQDHTSASHQHEGQYLNRTGDMVYSLLSILGTHNKDDMSRTLLAMSTSPDSCVAMRQSGCLPLLIHLLHSNESDPSFMAVRARASTALRNIVNVHCEDQRGRQEARVLRFLEEIRAYCDYLRVTFNHHACSGLDDHFCPDAVEHQPGPTIAALMKLTFDEEHRHAICTLGGIQAMAELLQLDHQIYGNTTDQYIITMRRYACMALTNLTFGDGTNKALLCSMTGALRALVLQLQSFNEDLCQVAASVLRNLSWHADMTSKRNLREAGSVEILTFAVLRAKKESTLKSLLSALWNFSSHCTENKVDICAVNGSLRFLVGTLSYRSPSKTLAIIENGGGILRNVSSHVAVREDYRAILRENNCLPILLKHLRSPSLTIVSNACGTLWNLSARCAEDQRILCELGAITMLKNLVHSKHRMISMGSSAALKNLLSSDMSSLDAAKLQTSLMSSYSSQSSNTPTLHVRRQKALESELQNQNLSETCNNMESPLASPTDSPKFDLPEHDQQSAMSGLLNCVNSRLISSVQCPLSADRARMPYSSQSLIGISRSASDLLAERSRAKNILHRSNILLHGRQSSAGRESVSSYIDSSVHSRNVLSMSYNNSIAIGGQDSAAEISPTGFPDHPEMAMFNSCLMEKKMQRSTEGCSEKKSRSSRKQAHSNRLERLTIGDEGQLVETDSVNLDHSDIPGNREPFVEIPKEFKNQFSNESDSLFPGVSIEINNVNDFENRRECFPDSNTELAETNSPFGIVSEMRKDQIFDGGDRNCLDQSPNMEHNFEVDVPKNSITGVSLPFADTCSNYIKSDKVEVNNDDFHCSDIHTIRRISELFSDNGDAFENDKIVNQNEIVNHVCENVESVRNSDMNIAAAASMTDSIESDDYVNVVCHSADERRASNDKLFPDYQNVDDLNNVKLTDFCSRAEDEEVAEVGEQAAIVRGGVVVEDRLVDSVEGSFETDEHRVNKATTESQLLNSFYGFDEDIDSFLELDKNRPSGNSVTMMESSADIMKESFPNLGSSMVSEMFSSREDVISGGCTQSGTNPESVKMELLTKSGPTKKSTYVEKEESLGADFRPKLLSDGMKMSFEQELALEENANLVLSILKRTSMLDSVASESHLLEHETISLISDDEIQDDEAPWNLLAAETAEQRRMPWSMLVAETVQQNRMPWDMPVAETVQQRKMPWDMPIADATVPVCNRADQSSDEDSSSESSDQLTPSIEPIPRPRPRIVKPGSRENTVASAEESGANEPKGIRGRRRALYSGKAKPITSETTNRAPEIKVVKPKSVPRPSDKISVKAEYIPSNKPEHQRSQSMNASKMGAKVSKPTKTDAKKVPAVPNNSRPSSVTGSVKAGANLKRPVSKQAARVQAPRPLSAVLKSTAPKPMSVDAIARAKAKSCSLPNQRPLKIPTDGKFADEENRPRPLIKQDTFVKDVQKGGANIVQSSDLESESGDNSSLTSVSNVVERRIPARKTLSAGKKGSRDIPAKVSSAKVVANVQASNKRGSSSSVEAKFNRISDGQLRSRSPSRIGRNLSNASIAKSDSNNSIDSGSALVKRSVEHRNPSRLSIVSAQQQTGKRNSNNSISGKTEKSVEKPGRQPNTCVEDQTKVSNRLPRSSTYDKLTEYFPIEQQGNASGDQPQRKNSDAASDTNDAAVGKQTPSHSRYTGSDASKDSAEINILERDSWVYVDAEIKFTEDKLEQDTTREKPQLRMPSAPAAGGTAYTTKQMNRRSQNIADKTEIRPSTTGKEKVIRNSRTDYSSLPMSHTAKECSSFESKSPKDVTKTNDNNKINTEPPKSKEGRRRGFSFLRKHSDVPEDKTGSLKLIISEQIPGKKELQKNSKPESPIKSKLMSLFRRGSNQNAKAATKAGQSNSLDNRRSSRADVNSNQAATVNKIETVSGSNLLRRKSTFTQDSQNGNSKIRSAVVQPFNYKRESSGVAAKVSVSEPESSPTDSPRTKTEMLLARHRRSRLATASKNSMTSSDDFSKVSISTLDEPYQVAGDDSNQNDANFLITTV